MSQANNDKRKNETIAKIESINAVDGFDPMSLAIEIGDLNEGGSVRYHLPVMTQIAWFRLKYPDGRIAVSVKPGNNCFIADARVYANYSDPKDYFLAEGSAARGISKEKASVSPREWAQTAAIGIALRNAGFGLQAAIAGESFEDNALYELLSASIHEKHDTEANQAPPASEAADIPAEPPGQSAKLASTSAAPIPEPESQLSPFDNTMAQPCPIMRYKDKTLGDMIRIDPKALVYVAKSGEKYGSEVADSAKLICDTALLQVSA